MRIGLAVIMLAAALAARGDALDVRTSQVDDLTGASRVVTNVTFDAEGAFNAISNRADALIKAVAPAPGDYGTVSNRAMSALQSHQSLAPSTNYTDAALGAFVSTGAVARANVYGTPTRWTDATGCVWEATLRDWVANDIGLPDGESAEWYGPTWNTITDDYYYDRVGWFVSAGSMTPEYLGNDENAVTLELDWGRYDEIHGYYTIHTVFTRSLATNLVGRVALTNEIPDVSGYATPADVTAAIREHSLMGIWDDKLGVWWTPHMSGGAYYWTATTNVNLAAEGNQ